jgi:hypothetical protein
MRESLKTGTLDQHIVFVDALADQRQHVARGRFQPLR